MKIASHHRKKNQLIKCSVHVDTSRSFSFLLLLLQHTQNIKLNLNLIRNLHFNEYFHFVNNLFLVETQKNETTF